MKNAFLFAGFLALTLSFTGCGDIQSHDSYPTIAVTVLRHGHPAGAGQAVGVAIRSHRDKPFTVAQPVATNNSGVARANFPTTWTNSIFTFPRAGAVPAQAPRPQYIVYVKGQAFPITPKTPNTSYIWNSERWETQTAVEVP